MSPIGKASSYLVRNPHSYCFRLRVPVDIQAIIGKKELRYSLKTGYIGHAKRKACLLAGLCWNLFNRIRSTKLKNMELPENEFKELIDNCMTFIEWNVGQIWDDIENPKDAVEWYGKLTSFIKRTKLDLYTNECKHLMEFLESMPWEHKWLQIDDGSKQWSEFNRTLGLWYLEMMKQERERLKAKYPELELERLYGNQDGTNIPEESAPATEQSQTILLNELWEDYKLNKIRAKRWTEGTVRNHQPKFNALLQFLGDKPVNQITKAMISEYRKVLDRLPVQFSLRGYSDLSGIKSTDLDGKHSDTLDSTTVREYMNLARSLFRFAEDNEYIDANPVLTGMIPPKKKQERSQRDVFTLDDLNRIFKPDLYLKWSNKSPARFFIPLLLLFTGCRLEEVASLYKEDVFQHQGIWCIEINNNNDRKVKNQNAIRTVPLHPIIIDEFKFPEYVSQVDHRRVFPELTPSNFKYGHEFSKRFGYYLRNTVKIKEQTKTLHSFRHTVSDHLYKNLVMESLIEELTGRAGKTETRRRYVKGYLAHTLFDEVITKLDYNLDLSHLKKSKWVIKP